MSNGKQPKYAWHYKSSKNPKLCYEMLLWTDGTMSCDCPGWTRRCVGGVRTCKHIRYGEVGISDVKAEHHGPCSGFTKLEHVTSAATVTTAAPKVSAFTRKFV